ncbi:energy transducer TonB [Acinetobacter sp. B10A]|uniref:energy transducer TonB n=1 Tax=Acinetobacter baretiae TaxID=2605383 RepID=UPI001B3C7A64|nr:energy transducer TonB [Acinetobacter baretiae]MBF7686543.1 energy transducer TonB [Acinetobacter baretiae]
MSIVDKDRQMSRWLMSLSIVLFIYATAIYFFMKVNTVSVPIPPQQPQTVMLELTQLTPMTQDTKPTNLPVGELKQEQHKAQSTQKTTVPKPKVVIEPVVSKKTEVIIPKPSKSKMSASHVEDSNSDQAQEKQRIKENNNEKDQNNVDQTSAPPSNQVAKDEKTAANQTLSGESLHKVNLSWQAMVLSRLEQFKRYPRKAQFNHQEGTTLIYYTINRQGEILSVDIARSSGFEELDIEASSAVKRTKIVPPPPDEIKGNIIELTTPINFFISNRK